MSLGYLILPASFDEVIPSLFSNNNKYTSSQVELSETQKSLINYPPGMIPLNFFLIYQGSHSVELVAFAQVRDYIYGIYYIVNNVRFNIDEMIRNRKPLTLPANAELEDEQYLEVYLDLGDNKIMLNGLDSKNIQSWVQYSKNGFFHDASIDANGIINSGDALRIIGLSKNLKICKREVQLGKGCDQPLVPKSASLKETLSHLFINSKIMSTIPGIGLLIQTNVNVLLSNDQKSIIKYPSEFEPLDFYVLLQTTAENPVANSNALIAFATKDGHLYGIYYGVTNQQFYNPEKLSNSSIPITLDSSATLSNLNYLESYFNDNNRIFINGLTYVGNFRASLQYATKKQYYSNWLSSSGIPSRYYFINPQFITGLSKTLNLSC